MASSDDEKPVEVIKRERNCPNPRPINVFFVQNSLKFIIFSSTLYNRPRQKPKKEKEKTMVSRNRIQRIKNENLRDPFAGTPLLRVFKVENFQKTLNLSKYQIHKCSSYCSDSKFKKAFVMMLLEKKESAFENI